RTDRPPANNLVEVQVRVRTAAEGEPQVRVQRWRVEREDGAILSFGQEQEFKRELPVGRYKVEAKVRQDADSPLLLVRGWLTVTASEAAIHPSLVVTK